MPRCRHIRQFQSTLPTRGSDISITSLRTAKLKSFNPRSPRGGATVSSIPCAYLRETFQSTLPTRGSDPIGSSGVRLANLFQSTLPTRGSDAPLLILRSVLSGFNPRSPRGGATSTPPHRPWRYKQFQSTLPTRGSDQCTAAATKTARCFNPRSPRGGATRHMRLLTVTNGVSIHAPHEGERPYLRPRAKTSNTCFNPRSPRGGATRLSAAPAVPAAHVSIHAPHEGERPNASPTTGAPSPVSIHAPHEGERRPLGFAPCMRFACFNPRSPRGGATVYTHRRYQKRYVSIHAPHEGERLRLRLRCTPPPTVSIHAPHEGERRPRWDMVL